MIQKKNVLSVVHSHCATAVQDCQPPLCYFKVSYCLHSLSCTSFHSFGLLSRSRSRTLLHPFQLQWIYSLWLSPISHYLFPAPQPPSLFIFYFACKWGLYFILLVFIRYVLVVVVVFCHCYCHQFSLQHYREYCLQLLCVCLLSQLLTPPVNGTVYMMWTV